MSKERHIVFYRGLPLELSYSSCGYFDNRPVIRISIGTFAVKFILPFHNVGREEECEEPCWGIKIHSDTLWIMRGNKWWTWELPFLSCKFIKHEVMCSDGWRNAKELGNRSKHNTYYGWRDDDRVISYHYPFTDKYDGTIIQCHFCEERREWRPKWLTWTKIFSKIKHDIDVEFDDEIGRQKGTWKGGVMGMGYNILEGETPMDTIRRMEKEADL